MIGVNLIKYLFLIPFFFLGCTVVKQVVITPILFKDIYENQHGDICAKPFIWEETMGIVFNMQRVGTWGGPQ